MNLELIAKKRFKSNDGKLKVLQKLTKQKKEDVTAKLSYCQKDKNFARHGVAEWLKNKETIFLQAFKRIFGNSFE